MKPARERRLRLLIIGDDLSGKSARLPSGKTSDEERDHLYGEKT